MASGRWNWRRRVATENDSCQRHKVTFLLTDLIICPPPPPPPTPPPWWKNACHPPTLASHTHSWPHLQKTRVGNLVGGDGPHMLLPAAQPTLVITGHSPYSHGGSLTAESAQGPSEERSVILPSPRLLRQHWFLHPHLPNRRT